MRRRWLGVLTLWIVLGVSAMAWAQAERPTDAYTPINKTVTGTNGAPTTTLWTPPTGQRIVLIGCLISVDRASTVNISTGGANPAYVIPPIYFNTQGTIMVSGAGPIFEGAPNQTLTYTVSAGIFSISCNGYEEFR